MRLLGLMLGCLVLALPVRATTSYNNLLDMVNDNPTLSFTSVDFTSLVGDVFPTFAEPSADYDLPLGLSFSGGGTNLEVFGSVSGWSGPVMRRALQGNQIDISLPENTVAFGAYFGQTFGIFASETTLVFPGGTYSFTPSGLNTPVYIALKFDAPVSGISLQMSGSAARLALNQFTFGTAPVGGGDPGPGGDVPEPSSMLLIGTGLVMVPMLRRIRRRR